MYKYSHSASSSDICDSTRQKKQLVHMPTRTVHTLSKCCQQWRDVHLKQPHCSSSDGGSARVRCLADQLKVDMRIWLAEYLIECTAQEILNHTLLYTHCVHMLRKCCQQKTNNHLGQLQCSNGGGARIGCLADPKYAQALHCVQLLCVLPIAQRHTPTTHIAVYHSQHN